MRHLKQFFEYINSYLVEILFGMVLGVLLMLAVVILAAGSPSTLSTDYIYISDECERFDAIYEDFISSYSYIDLSFKEKLSRFIGTSSLIARERKGGECWELSSIICSELNNSGIPCKICLGISVPHTWIKVYLAGQWYFFDPTDDIYRFKHDQLWGVYRDYESYKALTF